MKTRNLKFMALLLSVTMVFTSNVFAFGANEQVDVEAVEDEAPEVVGIFPSTVGDIGDYTLGYDEGVAVRGTDEPTGKKDEYDKWIKSFEKNKKPDDNDASIAFQAGFHDGYSGRIFDEHFDNAKQGFDDAFGFATAWDDENLEKTKTEKTSEYNDETTYGKEHIESYRIGYNSGETVGKEKRLLDAYQDGFNIGINDYTDYAKNDSYMTTDDYKTNVETPKKDRTGYLDEWKKGYIAGYDLWAGKEGYRAGFAAGRNDKRGDAKKSYDSVDKWNGKPVADVEKYETETPAPGFTAHWKTYWGQWKSKDDKGVEAETHGLDIVGAAYITRYKEGYKAGYETPVLSNILRDRKKDRYNEGFGDGYGVGVAAADNNDESKYTDDTTKAGGTYYDKVNNTEDDTPPGYKEDPYLQDYKDGYDAGYAAAFKSNNNTTVAYNKGYNEGYLSGGSDAANDVYSNNPYAGYYEPGDPKSAWSILTDATQYGKGYRTGYMDGYDTGTNFKYNDLSDGMNFDYSLKDFDEWRISSDPLTWNTTQLLVAEDHVQQDAAGVNDNYFFDTYGFWKHYIDNGQWGETQIDFRNREGEGSGGANRSGQFLATSPFQYYFDLYGNDHLIDKKTVSYNITEVFDDVYVANNSYGLNNGSVGMYNYAALQVSGNKPKKGVSDNGTPYVIIRYRLAGAETDENYTVWRYAYDANGNESAIIKDHIDDYYIGDDGRNEPVIPYDSRKIVGKKLVKKTNDQYMDNDKKNRYIIDAEALLITWEPGKPAVLVGPIDVDAKAKNNINATVSHNYLTFNGETEIAAYNMPNNLHGYDPDPVELKQTDKGLDPRDIAGGAALPQFYFSRYYKVAEENKTGENGMKEVMGRITFAPATNVPKLIAPEKGKTLDAATRDAYLNASSAFIKKKPAAPSFTLKAKKLSPAMKPYAKGIKKALKSFTANFEISRMKMASDYNSDINTVKAGGGVPAAPYNNVIDGFGVGDEDAMKLLTMPVAPSRSDFSKYSKDEAGTAKFKEDCQKYEAELQKYMDYATEVDAGNNAQFEKAARDSFKKAAEEYKKYYDEVVKKYGSHLNYFTKYVEEDWAMDDANDDIVSFENGAVRNDQAFPYTVTKPDRTVVGEVIPVGDTARYRQAVPEDVNCDGIITAIEHYEYITYGDVNDPRFDGVLRNGENIRGYEEGIALYYDTIDWNDVDVDVNWNNVNIADGVDYIDFTYYYYDADGVRHVSKITEVAQQDDDDSLYGWFGFPLEVYYDFLDDRETDIDIVETHDNIKVLWPGEENIWSYNYALDSVDLDFSDPKVKGGKKSQTLNIKPVLHLDVFNGWLTPPSSVEVEDGLGNAIQVPIPGTPKDPQKVDKKLKFQAYAVKDGAAVKYPKLGKSDLWIENRMAESEPFIVAKGVNNYEGQIAIRQRQNGSVGFGYFKNDDFYYVYNDEQ